MATSSFEHRWGKVLFIVCLVVIAAGSISCGSHSAVVFIGASTIERWPKYADFHSRQWVAKGISEETSSDVLARFDRDAAHSHAQAVQILVGINDMTSPSYDENVLISNWTTMIERGKSAGMVVYIGTLQPWGAGQNADTVRNARVDAANSRLKAIAPGLGATVIDYHEKLSRSDGSFIPEYTDDGIHPNQAGYDVMTKLADSMIRTKDN